MQSRSPRIVVGVAGLILGSSAFAGPLPDCTIDFETFDSVWIDDFRVNAPCQEDVNGDGTVNVLDLIDLLLCFGQLGFPACIEEDVNGDNTVNVLDLIALLLAFGTSCP